ncbi:MAG: 16S rRNA (guanine(527)-N(7))-methyltransferase RsmG [Alphaproteobacteria bacterium]|nr:16S rRNA (guanine(527)-N(7))-methyltransferase RsmG [Alphaproteobacteria bacterium]
MIADKAQARDWLKQLPECDATAIERLERLVSLLREENQRQNLVSRGSLEGVWLRHIADSAQLLCHVPRETPGPWLDLGTGAGFPGMVIAILCPDRSVCMVESRARRIEWLERLRLDLALDNASVAGQRLEDIPYRKVAVISARAFAPFDKLLDLSARFSTKDTVWLLPKGASAQHELDRLDGWNHAFHVEPSITDSAAGIIVGNLTGRKARKA